MVTHSLDLLSLACELPYLSMWTPLVTPLWICSLSLWVASIFTVNSLMTHRIYSSQDVSSHGFFYAVFWWPVLWNCSYQEVRCLALHCALLWLPVICFSQYVSCPALTLHSSGNPFPLNLLFSACELLCFLLHSLVILLLIFFSQLASCPAFYCEHPDKPFPGFAVSVCELLYFLLYSGILYGFSFLSMWVALIFCHPPGMTTLLVILSLNLPFLECELPFFSSCTLMVTLDLPFSACELPYFVQCILLVTLLFICFSQLVSCPTFTVNSLVTPIL